MALLAAAACRTAEAPPSRLEVGARLLDQISEAVAPCKIDDEIRPSFGCPALEPLVQRNVRVRDGVVRRRVRLPPRLRRRRLLVWGRLWPGTTDDDEKSDDAAEPLRFERTVDPRDTTFDFEMPVPADWPAGTATLQLRAMPRPLSHREVRATIDVPDGASLTFGLGLAAPSRVPAHVEVRLRSGDREVTLVDTLLEPTHEGLRRWSDQRYDLSEWAGQRVGVVFRSEAIAPADDSDPGFAFPAWGDPQLLVPARRDARNLILVSFDTLRADALGVYGDELGASPALDAFAAEGASISDAQAPFPATWASHLSLMTGVYPSVHGVLLQRGGRLPEAIPTLAERLARAGYQTAAVTENGFVVPQVGFSRGVSYYVEYTAGTTAKAPGGGTDRSQVHSGRADVTFARASDWIEAHRDEVFFLFLHTYQVHWPYNPPAEHDLFATPERRGHHYEVSREILSEPGPRREWARDARLAYAGELHFADAAFAGLLERLKSLSLESDTVVIVTADHGEAFDEHGDLFHSSLYNEVLRVPLLVRSPGQIPAGRRLNGTASLVDVVPTALDLVGLPTPADLQGKNLAPALRGGVELDASRPVFAESRVNPGQSPTVAVRRGPWKWIEQKQGPPEVYDLAVDPGERHDLSDATLAEEGRGEFADFRRDIEAHRSRLRAGDSDGPTLTRARERRLRALGYVD